MEEEDYEAGLIARQKVSILNKKKTQTSMAAVRLQSELAAAERLKAIEAFFRSNPEAADFEALRKQAFCATLQQSLESVDMAHLLASHNTATRHRRTNTMMKRAAEIAQGHEWTNSCNAKVIFAVASGFMTMRYVKEDPARLTIEQTSLLSSEMRDRALRELDPPAWGHQELKKERVPFDEPVLLCDHPDGTVVPLQPGLLQKWRELKYVNQKGDVAIETPECILLGREVKRDQYYMVVSLASSAIQVLASTLNWGYRNRDGHLGADYDCTSVSVLHQVHSWLEIMGMSILAKTYFINASARALEAELRRAKAKSKAQIVTSGPGVAEVFQILFGYGYGVRNWDNPMDAYYHAIPLSTIDKEDPAFHSIALLMKARAIQLEKQSATSTKVLSFPPRPSKVEKDSPARTYSKKRPRNDDPVELYAFGADPDVDARHAHKRPRNQLDEHDVKSYAEAGQGFRSQRPQERNNRIAVSSSGNNNGFPALQFKGDVRPPSPMASVVGVKPILGLPTSPLDLSQASQGSYWSASSQQPLADVAESPRPTSVFGSPPVDLTRALGLRPIVDNGATPDASPRTNETVPETPYAVARRILPRVREDASPVSLLHSQAEDFRR